MLKSVILKEEDIFWLRTTTASQMIFILSTGILELHHCAHILYMESVEKKTSATVQMFRDGGQNSITMTTENHKKAGASPFSSPQNTDIDLKCMRRGKLQSRPKMHLDWMDTMTVTWEKDHAAGILAFLLHKDSSKVSREILNRPITTETIKSIKRKAEKVTLVTTEKTQCCYKTKTKAATNVAERKPIGKKRPHMPLASSATKKSWYSYPLGGIAPTTRNNMMQEERWHDKNKRDMIKPLYHSVKCWRIFGPHGRVSRNAQQLEASPETCQPRRHTGYRYKPRDLEGKFFFWLCIMSGAMQMKVEILCILMLILFL